MEPLCSCCNVSKGGPQAYTVEQHTANKGTRALSEVGREFANMEFCGVRALGGAAKFAYILKLK